MTDVGSGCGCRLPTLTKRGVVIILEVIGGDSRAARSQRQTPRFGGYIVEDGVTGVCRLMAEAFWWDGFHTTAG
jgi:hypothetical protein